MISYSSQVRGPLWAVNKFSYNYLPSANNEPASTIHSGREFQLLTNLFAKKMTLIGVYKRLCSNI